MSILEKNAFFYDFNLCSDYLGKMITVKQSAKKKDWKILLIQPQTKFS